MLRPIAVILFLCVLHNTAHGAFLDWNNTINYNYTDDFNYTTDFNYTALYVYPTYNWSSPVYPSYVNYSDYNSTDYGNLTVMPYSVVAYSLSFPIEYDLSSNYTPYMYGSDDAIGSTRSNGLGISYGSSGVGYSLGSSDDYGLEPGLGPDIWSKMYGPDTYSRSVPISTRSRPMPSQDYYDSYSDPFDFDSPVFYSSVPPTPPTVIREYYYYPFTLPDATVLTVRSSFGNSNTGNVRRPTSRVNPNGIRNRPTRQSATQRRRIGTTTRNARRAGNLRTRQAPKKTGNLQQIRNTGTKRIQMTKKRPVTRTTRRRN